MNELSLVWVDPKPALCTVVREYFDDLPNVKTVTGCFEDLPEFDCRVNAANSCGLVAGGVAPAITPFFGDAWV